MVTQTKDKRGEGGERRAKAVEALARPRRRQTIGGRREAARGGGAEGGSLGCLGWRERHVQKKGRRRGHQWVGAGWRWVGVLVRGERGAGGSGARASQQLRTPPRRAGRRRRPEERTQSGGRGSGVRRGAWRLGGLGDSGDQRRREGKRGGAPGGDLAGDQISAQSAARTPFSGPGRGWEVAKGEGDKTGRSPTNIRQWVGGRTQTHEGER